MVLIVLSTVALLENLFPVLFLITLVLSCKIFINHYSGTYTDPRWLFLSSAIALVAMYPIVTMTNSYLTGFGVLLFTISIAPVFLLWYYPKSIASESVVVTQAVVTTVAQKESVPANSAPKPKRAVVLPDELRNAEISDGGHIAEKTVTSEPLTTCTAEEMVQTH